MRLLVKNIIFCMALLFALSFSALSKECTHLIGDCDYYLCQEKILNCGENGYFSKFAWPYCNRFENEVKPSFSPAGREWMDRVALCLRLEIEGLSTSTSCSDVKAFAIQSHTACYIRTGFCKLEFREKWAIFQTVHKELTDSEMVKVFLKIAKECSFHQEVSTN